MNLKKGFTIIEIMVVMALVFLLMGLIFASFTEVRKNSRDKQRVADLQTIRLALQDYHTICANFPDTLDQTVENCRRGTLLFSEIMSNVPMDPIDDATTYFYRYASLRDTSGFCYSYHIGAKLESENSNMFLEDDDFDSTGELLCEGAGFSGDDESDLYYDFIGDFSR